MRRIALLLAALAVLAAACGDADEGLTTTAPRDATGLSAGNLGAETDTSSTSEGETTTTLPAETCPLPQTLPRGGGFGPGLVRLHRAVTAFAESAAGLGRALEAAIDFSPGWGGREPVASAFYRMQADLYTLASLLERTYAADGATYSEETGWTFPDGYALAALAEPWAAIPEFQAVALTGFFAMEAQADAIAFFEGGGVCGLVAAFTAAIDQAAAESGA
jgi:hypothetical protein